MTTHAHKLNAFSLDAKAPVHAFPSTDVDPIGLTDPAIRTMTDLRRIKAITIDPESSIEFALQLMVHAGVRLLIVIDQKYQLAGLITARDIKGEKPLLIVTREQIKREDIRVNHVMTPRSELNSLNITDVENASVRDIVLNLREQGRQHAIVVEERDTRDGYFLRGIFSITHIGRQLGVEISASGHVQSFADLEQTIAETRPLR